jgi:hypothetical protein
MNEATTFSIQQNKKALHIKDGDMAVSFLWFLPLPDALFHKP